MSERDPVLFEVDPRLSFLGTALPQIEDFRLTPQEAQRLKNMGLQVSGILYFQSAFDSSENEWNRVASVYVGAIAHDISDLAAESYDVFLEYSGLSETACDRQLAIALNGVMRHEKKHKTDQGRERLGRLKNERQRLEDKRLGRYASALVGIIGEEADAASYGPWRNTA